MGIRSALVNEPHLLVGLFVPVISLASRDVILLRWLVANTFV